MDNSNSGSKTGRWLGISYLAAIGIIAGASLCICICAASLIFLALLPEVRDDYTIDDSQAVATAVLPDGSTLEVKAQKGYLAPDFQLENLAGGELTLSEFSGQPVVILYWASWCGYCKEELSLVQTMYPEIETQGIVVLAVNATDGDKLRDIERYLETQELSFPVLLDTHGQFNRDFGHLNSLPTTFFIDAEGIVQAVVIGTMPESDWDEHIADLQ
ncbi:MAG: TlpA family protein disulfide reductase [Anaerolineales bacterium]|nr:TlpA family protein disulfide reductase [Anaerolineales bacterium]